MSTTEESLRQHLPSDEMIQYRFACGKYMLMLQTPIESTAEQREKAFSLLPTNHQPSASQLTQTYDRILSEFSHDKHLIDKDAWKSSHGLHVATQWSNLYRQYEVPSLATPVAPLQSFPDENTTKTTQNPVSFSTAYGTLMQVGPWEAEAIISFEYAMHTEILDRILLRDLEVKKLRIRQESEMDAELQRITDTLSDQGMDISPMVTRHLQEIENLEGQHRIRINRANRKHRKDIREYVFKMYRSYLQKQKANDSLTGAELASVLSSGFSRIDYLFTDKTPLSQATNLIRQTSSPTTFAPVDVFGGLINKGYQPNEKNGDESKSAPAASINYSSPLNSMSRSWLPVDQLPYFVHRSYQEVSARRGSKGAAPFQAPHVSLQSADIVDYIPATASNLNESFSIFLGPMQVKQLFHVSMTTRDSMSRLVKPASQSDLQERTKQAMSLYSDQLIAIVLPYYFTTLRLDHLRELIQTCQMSSELHFDNVEAQLARIQEQLQSRPMRTGDFFVTRHSNLAGAHLIFHIVIDPKPVNLEELEEQTQLLMSGFQVLLHTASRCQVHHLSLPVDIGNFTLTESHENSSAMYSMNRSHKTMRMVKGILHDSCLNFRSETATSVNLQHVQFVVLDSFWEKHKQNLSSVFHRT